MAATENSSSSSSSISKTITSISQIKESINTELKPTKQNNDNPKKNKTLDKNQSNSPYKRNKSPGVRVINGRIYDPENGKSCHQCRQKTLDFSVRCKNLDGDKQCSWFFCHKCLLIRYGEKAEEMALIGDWKCPKCRGTCNCSICMKKRGCSPTGNIVRDAKASGFVSVSEILKLNEFHKGTPEKQGKEKEDKRKRCLKPKLSSPDEEGGNSEAKIAKKKDRCKKDGNSEAKIAKNQQYNNSTSSPSPSKRNKSPGVRVINGRIYDSVNGKCCHQCRQKTLDFSVRCKYRNEDKQCSWVFCHKCLLNRYGEKAEEMISLGDWKCPKCRGTCNCSICMKKRGCSPIGKILRHAKASGFVSVSDMLKLELYEEGTPEKEEKEKENNIKSSWKSKSNGHDKKIGNSEAKIAKKNDGGEKKSRKISKSAAELSKELNSFKKFRKDITMASGIGCIEINSSGNSGRKLIELGKEVENCKLKDMRKGEKGENLLDENKDNNVSFGENESLQDFLVSVKNNFTKENACVRDYGGPSKKRKSSIIGLEEKYTKKNNRENDEVMMIIPSQDESEENACEREDGQSKIRKSVEDLEEKYKMKIKIEDSEEIIINESQDEDGQVDRLVKHENLYTEVQVNGYYGENSLPQGIELSQVAKIDFAAEDIGHALQILEFCEAFGEVLNIEKGQPEILLQELASGQCPNGVGSSLVVQFHIRLLSMILKNIGKERYSLETECAWLQALSQFISDSKYVQEELLLDQSILEYKEYVELSSSKKLRLLTFLCDEALGSAELRSWMDKKILKHIEEERKAKERERKKEREMKMKLQNELATAVLAKGGAPLSVSENQDLVSKIKAEVAQILAYTSDGKGLPSKETLGFPKQTVVRFRMRIPQFQEQRVANEYQKSNAIRSEPMLLDGNGCKFWKLRGYTDEDIFLLQDIRFDDSCIIKERWFCYNIEEGAILEKYILRQLAK